MAQYERSKDKTIYEKKIEIESGSRIVVGIYNYNNGEDKLGLTRERAGAHDWQHNKIGRINANELKIIFPELAKINEKLNGKEVINMSEDEEESKEEDDKEEETKEGDDKEEETKEGDDKEEKEE